MSTEFDINTVRDHFPALKSGQIFFDNAGGSQVLDTVIESVRDYLANTNVQLGATYGTSLKSTFLYNEGYKTAAEYINATPEEVVIGSSTTQLFRNLSFALNFKAGDEIIISRIDHETNIDPWTDMAEHRGLVVKWWEPTNKESFRLEPKDLKPLLSSRTRMVTCTHASNVLGTINDIKAIAETVHDIPGALMCVDGVAYAPHRQIDVKELGVDFYAFSWYKVYGPHISMLYGRKESQKSVRFLGHYFNPSSTLQDKLALAGSSYELLHAIPAIVQYLGPDPEKMWQAIAAHEQKLAEVLLTYLTSRKDVRVYGERTADSKLRVPTISFTVEGKSSKAVVQAAERGSNLGFRWGHYYSHRLVTEILGLDNEGVIRVSMVHYNTVEEVEQLVEKLKEVLA
ncbi:MAG: hypothetical protein MMC33_003673 [Icmadophila ericetorum]|nr:hypothetical protein [Icmadophila ericetorum]